MFKALQTLPRSLRNWLPPVLVRYARQYRPSWRRQQASLAAAYLAIASEETQRRAAQGLAGLAGHKRAVVVGYANPKMAAFQIPLLLALRVAGFQVYVLLDSARGATADFYRKFGANHIVDIEELSRPANPDTVRALHAKAIDRQSLMDLYYRGVPIGRFVSSTIMRKQRLGSVDPAAEGNAKAVRHHIGQSVAAVDLASAVVDRVRPTLVCFYDRGYTPDGELFEVALAAGARAITFNAAHRSGLVISKLYDRTNKQIHFGAPSAESWRKFRTMPWTDAKWQVLRGEVEAAYNDGSWYDEVGTQFDKRLVSARELITRLKLDPSKKTAVVFPHLFWDATFFWGDDLFGDYRDWFCNVVRAAAANDRMNWIIKIHPANVVKNHRDGLNGIASEILAIRELLGELPPHMALVPPESPISTLSLFSIMDVCLTVRGTVGIEAAMYGIPVLTAGTGRYDRYGFTIDSNSRDEYLERLAGLSDPVRLDANSTETARRYAYGLFIIRPTPLETLKFYYRRDSAATLEVSLDLSADADLSRCADIARLADWLSSGAEDLTGQDAQHDIPNHASTQ